VQGLRKRLAILLTALAGASALLVWQNVGRRPPPPAPKPPAIVRRPPSDVEEIGWLRLDPGPRPPATMVGLKPRDLPAYYRSQYRLKPDRQILYAFEEVDRILSGRRQPATLSLRFESDHWSLRLGGDSIGELPEVPSFEDEDRLLAAWVRDRAAKYSTKWDAAGVPELAALAGDLKGGNSTQTIAALRAVNALAERHPWNGSLLRAAARGSIWLTLQGYDTLNLTDPLFGHALALLVLAEAAAPESAASDRALLLYWMGYSAAAEKASRTLPETDPVHASVMRDSVRLEAGGRPRDASPRAQYLYLLDLRGRAGRDQWFAALRKTRWARGVNPSNVGLLLRYGDYTTTELASAALAENLLFEVSGPDESVSSRQESLWDESGWPYRMLGDYLDSLDTRRRTPESQTRRFEQLVERHAASADGALYDAESERAFYRGSFYSAIAETASHWLDQQGVIETAEKFGAGIADPALGTATQLKGWILERVALDRGAIEVENAAAPLGSWTAIGQWPVVQIVKRIQSRSGSGTDPVRRAMQKVLFRRLDMRPEGLGEAATEARYQLGDLALGDRYAAALVREEPVDVGTLAIRYAGWGRDVRRLRELSSDRRLPAGRRAFALETLQGLDKSDSAFLEARYRELMAEQPENTSILDACVGVFRDAGDVAGGEAAITGWLARRPTKSHDLQWAHVANLRARLYASKKRWSEAWNAIEPALDSWMGEVLATAAWILEEQGKLDDALALARRTDQRYPNSDSVIEMIARLLWRQGKYAEAAETLASSRGLSQRDWDYGLANGFATVFADADPHRTQTAFTALRDRKVDILHLIPLAKGLGEKGNHKLAFALLTQLPATRSATDSAVAIWAYDQLEKADGKAAAADWLRKSIPVPHELALVAFQFQRYDILWETLEDPARRKKEDEMHLLRLAALILSGSPKDARWDELARYFGERDDEDWIPYARYLLHGGEPKFLEAPAKEANLTTVAWVAALKALSEGRYAEALDWFEVAIETDQVKIPPQAWSFETLQRWRSREKLFADFTPEDAFVVSPR
jgi:tetratricopeptide (TPR) repeat protein